MTTDQKQFAALKNEDWFNFCGEEIPRCPHCGKYSDVLSNADYDVMTDGTHEFECYHCEKPFLVTTNVDVSFSTYAQPGVK